MSLDQLLALVLDPDLLERVRHFHAADIQLYQRALQWRQARLIANPE